MKHQILTTADDRLFPEVWEIYEQAFPLCERRIYDGQVRIMSEHRYTLEVWTNEERVIGFVGWWNFGAFRYLEHFAVNPLCRSEGYGSLILSEWIRADVLPVVLEIEPVTDELTHRRQSFYHRLGFCDNSMIHVQPPYHPTTQPVTLWIMSYPAPILAHTYEEFRTLQKASMRVS
ncbi:MAG: GNAT family N-acetyltransferase, partial [Prevotellaceae bacterium]|jgi:ribosomal protein S18 acetylase RimI-like enzyme|nr:GNAT family N-acetyltransferase [Prevotellaceae bacterium]